MRWPCTMLSQIKRAFLALALALPLTAATVSVSDTIYDSAGVATTMDGTLFISNDAFIAADGDYIAASRREVTITDGVVSITLESNAGVTNPVDTAYRVDYQLNSGREWTEYWTIPASGPVAITAIVTFTPPTPSLVVALSQIAQGGATDAECMAWSDANDTWEPTACGAGSGAPTAATYITQTAHASLSAEQAMGALATGIVKNTTTTGVQSIAVDGDFPTTLSRDSEAAAPGDISGNLGAGYTIDASAVSADELDEAGVEAGLEAVLDHNDLQGIGAADHHTATVDTDTQLTQEQVEDFAGALVAAGTGTHTGITFTYQDATGDFDAVVGGLTATELATDSVSADELNATGVEAELEAVLDHNDLQGIAATDHHGAAAILAGASGGQVLIGGTGAGDDITLQTTSNVSKGSYILSELDCSGNANGGALTADASGVVTCTDDDGGSGVAFSAITGSTNTTAAMVVGTGASVAVSGSGTIAATTAAALAANGANCAAGSYPLGVDDAGATETCTDASTETDSIVATHTAIAGAHHTATVARTDAEIEDLAGGLFTLNTETGITATYQVADNTLDLVVGGLTATELATDSVSADELNALGVEAELEAVIDHNDLQGIGATDHHADSILESELASEANLETQIGVSITVPTEIDTSSELLAIVGDETGTGALVFGTSPTIVTPTIASMTNAQHDHADAAGGGSIASHIKSVWFGAALSADGTNCADPTEVTIGSWGKQFSFICTANDASILTGSVQMPDGWDAGTLTFELAYIQDAADTSALNADVSARCVGAAETPVAYGTEVAIDDAAVTGSDAIDNTTSAAVTAAGTCSAGDYVQFQVAIDGTGSTTAMATLNILGVKMEYTTGLGD